MKFEVHAPIAKRGVQWRLLSLSAVLFLFLGLATGWHLRLLPKLVLAGLALYALLGVARVPRKPGSRRHAIMADPTGLSVDGVRLMDRASIMRAYCAPADADDGDRHAVHIEGRFLRPACTVFVESAEEGQALLAALQADPSSTRAHFRALPPWAKHVRWLSIVLTASPWVFVNLLRLIPLWSIGIIVALYGVILLPTFLPQRVDVGHDGIFLRWLGNKRFIPFSDIDIVTDSKVGVVLFLRDDRHVEIRLSQKDSGAEAEVRALVARIKEGMAAQAHLTRADEEAFLARSGRELDVWMADMRALGAGEIGGYRVAAIPRERLWAVVENPTADPSAREGAALALSVLIDDDERARLSALALKTAQPRVRIALDGVSAEHDEARLRIALEAAESEAAESEAPEPEPSPRAARAQPRPEDG